MKKGQKAGSSPIEIEVVKGKSYYWCSCGKSKKQPFCDSSHKGSEFNPIVYKAVETRKIYYLIYQTKVSSIIFHQKTTYFLSHEALFSSQSFSKYILSRNVSMGCQNPSCLYADNCFC